MLSYTVSWFEQHTPCPYTTFRSRDMTCESVDYIIDYIISVTSLTPTVCTPVQSWSQWHHRNDVIKTSRGHISRTKWRRQARPMSFKSAHCVQHFSVWFLSELPFNSRPWKSMEFGLWNSFGLLEVHCQRARAVQYTHDLVGGLRELLVLFCSVTSVLEVYCQRARAVQYTHDLVGGLRELLVLFCSVRSVLGWEWVLQRVWKSFGIWLGKIRTNPGVGSIIECGNTFTDVSWQYCYASIRSPF